MISAAAFCPQLPALIPAIAGSAASELALLRAACEEAVAAAHVRSPQLVLLGAGPESVAHRPGAGGSLAAFGVAEQVRLGSSEASATLDLPLSLTVGAWLVREVAGPNSGAVGFSVGPEFSSSAAATELAALVQDRDIALVVMGDGSARRSTGAPGYLDDRAEPFDAAVADALRSGDGKQLVVLDADLGAELLAAGVAAWQAAGSLLAGARYVSELTYEDAPFGVGYFVAQWRAGA